MNQQTHRHFFIKNELVPTLFTCIECSCIQYKEVSHLIYIFVIENNVEAEQFPFTLRKRSIHDLFHFFKFSNDSMEH